MTSLFIKASKERAWLLLGVLLTISIYWPGLSGGWLFDDYPNIVDNHGVQPANATPSSLINAALSSPASDFKRPLASLSFAANYLISGAEPYWMKLTNLVIHLINGVLVFLLTRALLRWIHLQKMTTRMCPGTLSALIAGSWMLLPINLTGVLYVVQRMESIANAFVLLGLLGYVASRQRMLASQHPTKALILCLVSVTLPTAMGLLAKETAVMLPLYALIIEWILFEFRSPSDDGRDWRVISLFLLILLLPIIIGLIWLLPNLLRPESWATRDFTLQTRLLSEMRIVLDYAIWTLFPTPSALSFYHDDFVVSKNLLTPCTTLASMLALTALLLFLPRLRIRHPIAALGISIFLGCQLLTATILPLELIYEHRNYFASLGLLLTIIPPLVSTQTPPLQTTKHSQVTRLIGFLSLAGLAFWWSTLTALTAYAWGDPLRLARELASRAPESPRAQYELGRTYIIYSRYEPASPFTSLAYAPLEKAASLPQSSILPLQALIFMNSRMHRPLKDRWWNDMVAKLKANKPGVQDESSLGALTQCQRVDHCDLPTDRMNQAFIAALSHPNPSARLSAMYGDYAWNVLKDHPLGEQMTTNATQSAPNEPAYRITLIRMLVAQSNKPEAKRQLQELDRLNIGGRLDSDIDELRGLMDSP